jgi:hypothetical protein
MATVPFVYECSKEAGFVMDPNEHKRFGYVTELDGFGLTAALTPDLQVNIAYNGEAAPTFAGLNIAKGEGSLSVAKVVGVLEKFEWNGGVGDPLQLDFFVSQENAMQIKALQQMALKTTSVKKLGWWIGDYDQELKKWFEQANPKSGNTITGIITGKENPELNVDLNGVVVKDGIDVNVYKVSIKVVPAANKAYTLHFANSASKNTIKSWGLVVGTLAGGALPG